MPGDRRRMPRHLHRARGNRRNHRSRSGALKPAPEGQLTEAQRILLGFPKELLSAGRRFDVEHVHAEWWLQPIDPRLLLAFSLACVRHADASRALDTCRRDPLFADPSSEVSQAGAAYCKLVDQTADEIIKLGEKIGFRTIGRPRLGVDADELPKPKSDDS
jgi:hypothetical protein